MNSSVIKPRRRRWSSEQRQQFLADFHQIKMSQKDFANSHGVGLSTLHKWLRQERNGTSAKVKFQEIRLPAPVPLWPVEVVSPQGWIVRLQNDSVVAMLSELLLALPC
jgi:transposase-like protein